jgi:HNH endonuclease
VAIRLYRRYVRKRRFWACVEVTTPDGCWPWKGAVDGAGQPCFDGRPARDLAYELARGPVPAGAAVAQRCGHARCMNPEHLELAHAP